MLLAPFVLRSAVLTRLAELRRRRVLLNCHLSSIMTTTTAERATSSSMLPFDATSSVWADIKPVPQDDGPAPLCPILYAPEFSQAMDLLRALLPADELSPRSLALTEHLSKLCPSSYTVWHFRARILVHGNEDSLGMKEERLRRELTYLDDLAKTNMKNYQVWQHRKLIVSALGDPSHELNFVAQVLQEDSKNYHTWVYRQWVLAHFGGLPTTSTSQRAAAPFPALWDGELKYVDTMLAQDARNNSAWNHRYYCLFASRWATSVGENERARKLCQDIWRVGVTEEECVKNEVAFAKDHIKLIPNNASAWNYLRGVSRMLATLQNDSNPFEVAVDLATSLVPSSADAQANPTVDEPPNVPPLALEWLLDDVDAKIRLAVKLSSNASDEEAKLVADAELLVQRLIVADAIRTRYWSYRLTMIRRAAAHRQSSH